MRSTSVGNGIDMRHAIQMNHNRLFTPIQVQHAGSGRSPHETAKLSAGDRPALAGLMALALLLTPPLLAEEGAAGHYLSSKIGLEASAFAGVCFNTVNEETDYRTGEQFHLDVTLAQHLPLGQLGLFGLGVNGFYYQQITGDSGSGAILGDFKGRTVGVGPVLSWATKVGYSASIIT